MWFARAQDVSIRACIQITTESEALKHWRTSSTSASSGTAAVGRLPATKFLGDEAYQRSGEIIWSGVFPAGRARVRGATGTHTPTKEAQTRLYTIRVTWDNGVHAGWNTARACVVTSMHAAAA